MSIENDMELTKLYESKYCLNVFAPAPIAFTKGKGVWLYDTEGRKYMDMIGGIAVNSLGHGNKALTKAVSEQANKLIHCSNYYMIPQRAELAFKLCSRSFADKAFFCNSGAEANEAAIKIARSYFYYKGQPEKNEIITTEAIEDMTEATPTEGSTLKTIGIVGLGLIAAAAVVKFAVIPMTKKIKREITKRKVAKRHTEEAKEEETDLDDMDLDEIPEIDE